MKQKSLLKTMLLLFALIAGSSSVWADEVLHYTLDGTVTTGGNSNYDQDGGGLTQDGISWSVTGNTTINPWRIGGKVASGTSAVDRAAYSKTAMGSAITKVELVIGDINLSSVNSIKLIVASNSDFSTVVDEITKSPVSPATSIAANQTLTFQPTSPATTWATGAYYKFVFNVTLGTSNKYIQVKSAKFYKEVTLTDPTITFNDGSVRIAKTLDVSTLFTSNSNGAVTYSITSGDSYATLDGSTLTGVAIGSVTVKAQQAAKDEYNAAEKSATISVVDPALSSIAITTAPTKTTYDAGEVFDATGMVVTATFADASEEDVSASCTWTPSGALTTSDTEVTVSYTYKGVTKTATQDITVNAYVQPLSVTINMDYEWLGSTKGKNLAAGDLPVVKNDDHVTTTITDGTSTRPRGDETYIRVYTGSTITFAAPLGYCIKQLVFTTESTWNAPKASTGTLSSKTWTGKAPSVTFYLSGSCFINSVAVTLEAATAINIDITSANWASFSSAYEVEIPAGVTAYYAQQKDAENVTLKEIMGGYIPANTGVVVYSATAKAYTANITTTGATLGETNILKPWLTAGTPTDGTYYTLAAGPKFKKSSGGILAAGKAYLVLPTTAPELNVNFGETTGIDEVRGKMEEVRGDYYNLAGQRVAQPTKGLYIVNGKKVILK